MPGVLRYYDLPDLAARLAPVPLEILGPTDALGKPVSKADLDACFATAVRAYEKRGGLVLKPAAAGNEARLPPGL